MKIPRIRFTLRRLILVVAIAAVFIFGEGMRRRRQHYSALAARFGGSEKDWTFLVERCESNGVSHQQTLDMAQDRVKELEPGPVRVMYEGLIADSTRMIGEDRLELPKLKAVLAHETSFRRKYERAARFPWLLVPPVPPTPR